MITKWRTTWVDIEITPVQCVRETDKMVWIAETKFWKRERCCKKVSEYEQYHDTWEAAHDFLVDRTERKLSAARNQVRGAELLLADLQSMQPPSEGYVK